MNPIVGIGELLWDVYPDGRRIAGGAPFNFAFHCHQLGHPAVIVSRVGDDDLGRELRERVRDLGLSDEFIQTDCQHPTGTVTVALDASAVPTYTITENVAWDHIAWDEKLAAVFRRAHSICFGSLAQRSSGTRDIIRRAVPRSMTSGRFPAQPLYIFDVNLRPPFYNREILEDSFQRCNWAKLNHDELFRLVDLLPLAHFDEMLPAAELRATYKFGLICVTCGSAGASLTSATEHFHETGVPARVVDTVGAGDAFTAAMVCLHLEGRPLRECARFANHYAARVCEEPGGTPRIDRREVETAAGLLT